MKICSNCLREAGGFGFIPPPLRAGDPRNRRHRRFFCSRNCQEIFSNNFRKNKMIDITKLEKDAIESSLKPLGEYVAEIGMDRPLADYSREEVLCLIEVAVTAYWDFMQGKEDNSEVVPCN